MLSCGGTIIPGLGRKVAEVFGKGNVAAVAGGSRALCPPRHLDIGVPPSQDTSPLTPSHWHRLSERIWC
jgi:hypothetical protein